MRTSSALHVTEEPLSDKAIANRPISLGTDVADDISGNTWITRRETQVSSQAIEWHGIKLKIISDVSQAQVQLACHLRSPRKQIGRVGSVRDSPD